MHIDLARTFLEVVACGSLARASERLNVTHSTVTMRIKALEDIVGRRLLIRDRGGAKMTSDGVRFHRFAESLVRTWQTTKRQMSLGSGFEGILSIGADVTLWDDLMFDWARKTRRQRPEIALRCESGHSTRITERLFKGWLDVCLVYEAQLRSGFAAEKLFDDPLVMVSTEKRGRKEHWDPDFVGIYWDEGIRHQELQLWGNYDETPHVSVDSKSLGMRFVTEFGGSMRLPRRVLERESLPRPLYEVPDVPVMERTVYYMYSEEALKVRIPKLTARSIRDSILAQLAGDEVIWPQAEQGAA